MGNFDFIKCELDTSTLDTGCIAVDCHIYLLCEDIYKSNVLKKYYLDTSSFSRRCSAMDYDTVYAAVDSFSL